MGLTGMHLSTAIILLFLFSNCDTEEFEINDVSSFEDYIQEEMDDQNIPALSILIFKEDDILYEDYLGTSHIQQDVPLDDNDLFLLASVSKVVTATALLQLYDQGHFSLDDNINDYLSFEVSHPDYPTDITFRMLLTHTSAIADGSALDDQYYYGKDSPVELEYFLENYFVPSGEFYNRSENYYDFDPGDAYEYSNMGSALIGLLTEQISGLDFNSYCKQYIFEPLGMNETFWRLDEIEQTIVQPYDYENGKYLPIQHYTFTDYPNGGLRSTGRDLFKLLRAFVQSEGTHDTVPLKESTIKAMTTLQIPSLDDEMGLHLFYMDSEYNLWGHDGGEQGVSTIMGFNPISKIGAIILTNQGDAYLDDILIEAYRFGKEQ